MFSIRNALILVAFTGLSLGGCGSDADAHAKSVIKDSAANAAAVPASTQAVKNVQATKVKSNAIEPAQKILNTKYLESFSIDVDGKPLCGYKDSGKTVIVKPIYDICGEMVDGMAYIGVVVGEYNDQYKIGYIDRSGEIAIPVAHTIENDWSFDVRDFSEGLVAIKKDGKWGYLDKSGKVVIDYIYDSAGDFSNSSAPVSKHEQGYGLISKTGAAITELKYGEISDYSDGFAIAKSASTNKYGVIDSKGNIHGDFAWDNALWFSEGLAAVAIQSGEGFKWGFIDQAGKIVIKPTYDMAMVDMGGDSVTGVGGFFEDGAVNVYNQLPDSFSVVTINKAGEELKIEYYDEMMDAFVN